MATTGVIRINDPNGPHHGRDGVVSARVDVRLFATDTEPERYATFPAGHVEPVVSGDYCACGHDGDEHGAPHVGECGVEGCLCVGPASGMAEARTGRTSRGAK